MEEVVYSATYTSPIGGSLKRVFDVVFSTLAIIAFLPLFLLVIVLVKLFAPGPVFFRQERIGFNGEKFQCIKFRTMVVDAERALEELLKSDPEIRQEYIRSRKIKNDPRIIPFIGSFLRKSSLDELPQFINVLRGDMSIVGPRPIQSGEMSYYGRQLDSYLRARPGITGVWQTHGRSGIGYEERVQMDSEYVGNWTFMHDIWLVFKTVHVVLVQKGSC